MSVAVHQGRYGSLASLVESWPHMVCKLKKLSLPYLSSLHDNLDTEDRKSLIKKSPKLVITPVNKIVHLVKSGKTCITVLDISGYPLDTESLVSTLNSFQTTPCQAAAHYEAGEKSREIEWKLAIQSVTAS